MEILPWKRHESPALMLIFNAYFTLFYLRSFLPFLAPIALAAPMGNRLQR